ncbi:PREDICTED: profilin-like isoform X3 [Acropora digitifera]|nr:PREDICTED: profilin-like isoform X3 [Acropora digitifera]XP_015769033.1 PREDICTED: profilin-like isoform X3 [Acropora digitifera]XP_015769034.1 PREDICTED: profilin-like isoform X3 [Acropora digitifera]
MSWDSYIDNLIAQTKDASGKAHCDKACIIGLDGGAPWTTSNHPNALELNHSEAQTISRCFRNKDFSLFMCSGVDVDGNQYMFLRVVDDKIVLAKRADLGCLTLQASKTAIIIAHTAEGFQFGNVNKGVNVIAEYLESLDM